MKTAVIILLIAVLFIQCELSFSHRTKSINRRRIVVTPPGKKSTVNNSISSVDGGKGATIIKGEKGVIKVNGKVVQKNDKEFKKGIVVVTIRHGRITINGNSVLERKPSSPNNFSATNIFRGGIQNFEIKVKKNGLVQYTDDKTEGSVINADL